MTAAQHASFVVFMTPHGYHEAGWRMHHFDKSDPIGLQNIMASTAIAERGLLDAVFFADRLALTPFRARAFPQFHFDPIEMLTALAMRTSRVGLIATASTTFSTPWDLARRFATADHISGGRIGWNVVTTYDPKSAELFGTTLPHHDDRYARASEFVTAARRMMCGFCPDSHSCSAEPQMKPWSAGASWRQVSTPCSEPRTSPRTRVSIQD
jgi:alkanesulfonate monooxygenase SsuD/methylene tetrahydromethanopterin reductase-like flavin-dependent oxidoreductase (luciferase family)